MKRIYLAMAAVFSLVAVNALYGQVSLGSVRIFAKDTDTAAKFYQKAFGMHEVHRIDVPGGTEIFVNFGKDAKAAKDNKSAPFLIVPGSRDVKDSYEYLTLDVQDMKATVKAIEAAGGSMEGTWGHLGNSGFIVGSAIDPAGNHIGLIQRTKNVRYLF